MKIEIQVVSRDVISPSSPTPDDQKIVKLSYLDQMNPRNLLPYILFYQTDGSLSDSEISNRLKKSLSETLTLYYPLAGRFVGNTAVSCNDEGVLYVEAQANGNVLDVVNEPIPDELSKLLLCNLYNGIDHCLAIQATFFTSGGLAIGIALSHKVADGWSLFQFLNSWASISRGDNASILPPRFDCANFFPPRAFACSNTGDGVGTEEEEEVITKGFLFTVAKINELKKKYAKHKTNEDSVHPSRTEALSAFILTRFMVSTQIKHESTRICTLIHPVSIRKRAVPPFPDNLFGNLFLPVMSSHSVRDDEEATYGIVEKMRQDTNSINAGYVSKVMGGSDHYAVMTNQLEKFLGGTGEEIIFVISSICGFPLYQADFGWGRPIWAAIAKLKKNIVMLLDSYSGSGIEAWVTLKAEDMAKFEADEELLAYLAD